MTRLSGDELRLVELCAALTALLAILLVIQLWPLRRSLAAAEFRTVVEEVRLDLVRDEVDGLLNPDAAAVRWLHAQLGLLRLRAGHPFPAEALEAVGAQSPSPRLTAYAREVAEAQRDYLDGRLTLSGSRSPRPRHADPLVKTHPAGPSAVPKTRGWRATRQFTDATLSPQMQPSLRTGVSP